MNNEKHKKTKVGLVQINNSFSNQNYLPYSVGLFHAFAQRHLKNVDEFEFLLPIYKRIPIENAVKDLSITDIVFFSTYVWNTRISLEIARRLKQAKPEILTVFGGPSIPEKNVSDFMKLNPFVDITCFGEGERVFCWLLENYHDRRWEKVPSISYINESNRIVRNPGCERISDLNIIPSPFLEGVFEPLIQSHPEEQWIALWETDRGCPFSCTYCDWGSATKNRVFAYDVEKIFREIDWFARNKIEFVFCCDANFGILPRDREIVSYFAETKRKEGYPKVLSVQNTKNSTDALYDIYKIMSDAKLNKGVALSLQSFNMQTLRDIKRENISIDTFKQLQEKFTEDGIETFTDLILGLPSETYETFIDGVSSVIENGQHNRIQFNNLSILPNAQMADPEYQKKFGLHIVETKIINIHGRLNDTQELYETQKLVVGTNTMPDSDWLKVRAFSWMAALLHFDKLLQIPFIILHNAYSVTFKELIEAFIDNGVTLPIMSQVRSFFTNKANDIQKGGLEYCESKEWLNIWWPADELILIKICTEDKLSAFYGEAEEILSSLLKKKKLSDYQGILHDSILLNQNLIKLPFRNENVDLELSYNLWDVYNAVLRGKHLQIKKGVFFYRIDCQSMEWSSWEDWCREVIWYENKKGAYIYGCREFKPQVQDFNS